MDEEKKNVNTENNTNNMDYSFDFANQVEETPSVQSDVTGENQAVANNVVSEESSGEQKSVETASDLSSEQKEVVNDAALNVASTNEQPADTASVTDNSTGTAEAAQVQPESEESEELIKDKKATKKFLIILFVIVLAFIIALPLIKGFLG